MAKDKNYAGEKMQTPVFRAAFVNVFDLNKNGKYSIAMLFPKSTDLSAFKKAVKDLAISYFGTPLPANLKSPFKDGDEPNSEGNIFDGYPGNIVINATTGAENPIKVVDQNRDPILTKPEFYSGVYARAMITPFAYSNKGKGISFFLGNIQKVKEGEPFGVSSDPKAEFDNIESSESAEAYAGNTDDVSGEELLNRPADTDFLK